MSMLTLRNLDYLHELDDRGFVSPRCDVEIAVREYQRRIENDDWPTFAIPERARRS